MNRWCALLAFALIAPNMARADDSLVDDPKADNDALQSGAPSLHLQVEHRFSRDVARTRICQLLQYWGERFGVQSRWDGDRVRLSGHIFGMRIDAAFDVTDRSVVAVARDPGFIWRGQTEHYVRGKLKKYLHPEYAEL